jgi:cyclopropane fatty-acyl-phospholipid synthase-like methyltransferase
MSTPAFDFDEVFDEDYLFFYEPLLAEVADGDVNSIWRLLELEPGLELLDLACGHGRIANRLAVRGARVTALALPSSSSPGRATTPRRAASTSTTWRATCARCRGRTGASTVC